MNVITLPKIWEQMDLAVQYDAKKIWIVNVGDLKPMEYPIEFFLSMAWDPSAWPKERLVEYGQLWAAREFGPEHAVEIERIMHTYTQHNYRRHPELLAPDTYSVLHYNEADRIVEELDTAWKSAEAIYAELPEEKQDAFYQLVLHPIKSVAVINHLWTAAGKNHAYAKQGRVSANQWAEEAHKWFDEDQATTDYYHHELADGKWNHFMSQTHIGYTYWNQPPENVLPPLFEVSPISQAYMGVALEGQTRAHPQEGVFNYMFFDSNGAEHQHIDIFNRGSECFKAKLSVDQDWVKLCSSEVCVTDKKDARINISIDWDKLPASQGKASINIKGPDDQRYQVNIIAKKTEIPEAVPSGTLIEADGYVSIDAEQFTGKQDVGSLKWEVIPNHGRTRSGVGVFPREDRSFDPLKETTPYLNTLFTSRELEHSTWRHSSPRL